MQHKGTIKCDNPIKVDNKAIIEKTIIVKPAAKPSKPSNKLIALVIPIIHKYVMK